MKLKLDELVDMFDELQNYECIVYDKKEYDFIFIDLNMMSIQEYEELTDKIEEDEEERYYYLPSSYVFHDSELIEEYIDKIKNEKIQEKLYNAFYGKGKDKLFYYRGLKEYQNKTEKGYLIDTCLNAQDQYISMIEYYLK